MSSSSGVAVAAVVVRVAKMSVVAAIEGATMSDGSAMVGVIVAGARMAIATMIAAVGIEAAACEFMSSS